MKKDKNYKLPSDFGVQFLQDFCDDSWNQAYVEERMEKFKFGPLIYNGMWEEDESGNYYWPGKQPVGYDESGIPIDSEGRQCLPLSCPFHPYFVYKSTKKSEVFGNVFLPTNLSSYYDWCNENFINASADVFKKDILRKALRDAHGKSGSITPNQAKMLYQEVNKLEK